MRWALWPSGPLWDAQRERAWILYGLYNDELASGIGVAVWTSLDQPVERLQVDGSYLLFPAPEPEWANAPVVAGDWLYAFGCVQEGLARPLDRWLLVYSEPFDRDVVAPTAPSLTGPWSHEQVLLRASGASPYDAVHHPELELDDGLVQYITYSRLARP